MPGKYEHPRSGRQPGRKPFPIALVLIIGLVLLCVIALAVNIIRSGSEAPPTTDPGSTETTGAETTGTTGTTGTSTETTQAEPVKAVSSATISATGDLLMHLPLIENAYDSSSGAYNFDNIFSYVTEYTAAADYAVANLETTLRSNQDGYDYSGYPCFNCPDEIIDSVQSAGFDMLLTANNHSYDTRLKGMTRTLEVIDQWGLDRLGTMLSADEPKYTIKEINGIRIGMICYTYETVDDYPDRPSLNGILTAEEAIGMINTFDYTRLEEFYTQIGGHIDSMKTDGAEAIVLFIHWGNEYWLEPNDDQVAIAQKMCDLGVDVIVGGHPHVVEPLELLHSTTDPEHETLCLYSMGNAVSNQRAYRMNLDTGHTEDGVLFSFTFTKYSDGTVALEGTDILPTWVYLHQVGGKYAYQILPLDDTRTDWKEAFGLSDYDHTCAQNSYERTMDIVGEGLEEAQSFLAQEKQAREGAYAAMAQNAE